MEVSEVVVELVVNEVLVVVEVEVVVEVVEVVSEVVVAVVEVEVVVELEVVLVEVEVVVVDVITAHFCWSTERGYDVPLFHAPRLPEPEISE